MADRLSIQSLRPGHKASIPEAARASKDVACLCGDTPEKPFPADPAADPQRNESSPAAQLGRFKHKTQKGPHAQPLETLRRTILETPGLTDYSSQLAALFLGARTQIFCPSTLTREFAGTDSVTNALPAMTLPAPTTVSPPSTLALE